MCWKFVVCQPGRGYTYFLKAAKFSKCCEKFWKNNTCSLAYSKHCFQRKLLCKFDNFWVKKLHKVKAFKNHYFELSQVPAGKLLISFQERNFHLKSLPPNWPLALCLWSFFFAKRRSFESYCSIFCINSMSLLLFYNFVFNTFFILRHKYFRSKFCIFTVFKLI